AAPREVVRSRAEALELAGLEVSYIGIEPLVMLEAIGASSEKRGALWQGQPIAYVMFGENSSGMCVVQDSTLRFVRAISWGGGRVTQALAESLHVSDSDAAATKEHESSWLDEDGRFHWYEEQNVRSTDALKPEMDRLR